MNRRPILNLAIKQSQGINLENSADQDNRSIFKVIRAVLNSAPSSSLDDARKMLNEIVRLDTSNDSPRFRGVKLQELVGTIKQLFSDSKNVLLSDKLFGSYEREDLISYLEICRRIYISGFQPREDQSARAQNNPNISTKETNKDVPWELTGLGLAKVQVDLQNGDKVCAKYVIEHESECKNKQIIALAKNVLEG